MRACIERGRLWQAEHYFGAVRDHGLSLACLCLGLPARGYDDLPAEARSRFDATRAGSTEPGQLGAALTAGVEALLLGGADSGLPRVDAVVKRLGDLRSP